MLDTVGAFVDFPPSSEFVPERSAKSAAVTVTTLTGHVSTVVVFDCSARSRSLCLMARSARCDVRLGAAVFVGSDETIVPENQLLFLHVRRLRLQIGGANIAGADRAG